MPRLLVCPGGVSRRCVQGVCPGGVWHTHEWLFFPCNNSQQQSLTTACHGSSLQSPLLAAPTPCSPHSLQSPLLAVPTPCSPHSLQSPLLAVPPPCSPHSLLPPTCCVYSRCHLVWPLLFVVITLRHYSVECVWEALGCVKGHAVALYGSNEYSYSVGDLLTTVCVYSVCPMCVCSHFMHFTHSHSSKWWMEAFLTTSLMLRTLMMSSQCPRSR